MNTTLTTIEVFAEQLKNRTTAIRIVESLSMLLINLSAFAGNLLLGIAVVKNPNLWTATNIYIVTLAFADFLLSLVGIPFTVSSLIVGTWPFNNFVCQLQGFCILLKCAISLQTLAVTAVNRYFWILRSRALYLVWIMALFASLPYVVSGYECSFHPAKAFCVYNAESLPKDNGAYLFFVSVAIPLIIIITCYTSVFMALRKHSSNFGFRICSRSFRSQSKPSIDGRLSEDEVNITYTLLVVVCGFLACWTPVVAIDMIDFINADCKLKRQVYVSYTCFVFASASLNPVICGIMNLSFRREYARILASLKLWSSHSHSKANSDGELKMTTTQR